MFSNCFRFLFSFSCFQEKKKKKIDLKVFKRDKYSKPTWGLARFHFTYPRSEERRVGKECVP